MTKILDLDFMRNRSYPDAAPISGRNVVEIGFPRRASSHLSVVRASPATTYAENMDGTLTSFSVNTPRITDKGLLVEESRTNIFLNSFTPATQTVTVTNTTEYTFSMRGTGSIALTGGATGTVTDGSPVTVTTTSTSVTATLTGSATFMQAEAGGHATSPIPTTTAAVTRDADDVKTVQIGSLPFSGFSATEGTVLVDWYVEALGGTQAAFSLDDGTALEFINAGAKVGGSVDADVDMWARNASGTQAFLTHVGGYVAGQRCRQAVAWKVNDYASSLNGGAPLTDTLVAVPTLTTLQLGSAGASIVSAFTSINSYIRSLTYYDTRLSDARIQELSA